MLDKQKDVSKHKSSNINRILIKKWVFIGYFVPSPGRQTRIWLEQHSKFSIWNHHTKKDFFRKWFISNYNTQGSINKVTQNCYQNFTHQSLDSDLNTPSSISSSPKSSVQITSFSPTVSSFPSIRNTNYFDSYYHFYIKRLLDVAHHIWHIFCEFLISPKS